MIPDVVVSRNLLFWLQTRRRLSHPAEMPMQVRRARKTFSVHEVLLGARTNLPAVVVFVS